MPGKRVIIIGEVYDADLGIGGGPILPSPQPPQPGYPSHPWVPPGGSPSHPWVPPGGSPTHPWVPPPPYPDQGLPPYPDQGLPGQPPGFWGGVRPPWVDNTLPGGGGRPPGYWGPNDPRPTPPIFIPPNAPPVDPPEDTSKIEWHSGWTADKGWVTVGIVTPEKPVPTPSS